MRLLIPETLKVKKSQDDNLFPFIFFSLFYVGYQILTNPKKFSQLI